VLRFRAPGGTKVSRFAGNAPHLFVYGANMEAMREAWTDERLDDLTVRMDRGFDRVDRDLRELRAEMVAGFDRVEGRMDRVEGRMDRVEAKMERLEGKMERLEAKMDKRFERLDARFDSMWRMTLGAYLTIVGLIVTQI